MTLLIIGDGAESKEHPLGDAVSRLDPLGVWATAIDGVSARASCLKGGPDDLVRWAVTAFTPEAALLVTDGQPYDPPLGDLPTTFASTDDVLAAVEELAAPSGASLPPAAQTVHELLVTARRWPSPRPQVRDRSPRVSVVPAVYNQQKYLHPLMRSVLAEDYDDFEVVVIDDGSTDASSSILRQYASDPRVRVISQPNIGQTGRLDLVVNRLVRESRGELIAWLGGDDVTLPHRLSTQVAAFDEDPGLDICHSASWYIDEAGHRLPGSMTLTYTYDDYSALRRMSLVNSVSTPTTVVHRRAFEKVGLHEQGISCDYHFWLKSAGRLRYRYLPQRLMEYRLHPKSLSTSSEGNIVTARESVRFRRLVVHRRRLADFWPELAGTQDARVWYEAGVNLGNSFQQIDLELSLYFYGLAEEHLCGPELLHNRAVAHLKRGQRREAERDADTAAALDPVFGQLARDLREKRSFSSSLHEPQGHLLPAVARGRVDGGSSARRWDGTNLDTRTAYVSFGGDGETGSIALAAWAHSTRHDMSLRWAYPTLGLGHEEVLEHLARTAHAAGVDLSTAAPLQIEPVDDFALLPRDHGDPKGHLEGLAEVQAYYQWMVDRAAEQAAIFQTG